MDFSPEFSNALRFWEPATSSSASRPCSQFLSAAILSFWQRGWPSMPARVLSIPWAPVSCLATSQRLVAGRSPFIILREISAPLSALRWLPSLYLYGLADSLCRLRAFSLAMGLTLFMLRDHASAPGETKRQKGNFKANLTRIGFVLRTATSCSPRLCSWWAQQDAEPASI